MNTRKKWYSRVFALAIALALMASVAVPVMAPPDVSADPDAEWSWEWVPEVSGPEWLIAPNSEIYDFAANSAGDIIYAVGMGVEVARFDYDGGTWSEATARLWKSEDGAVTWEDITDEITDNTDFEPTTDVLRYVALAPDNDDMVFVATATEVYGSDEGGDDFSATSGLELAPEEEIILSLAVSCESDDTYNVALGTSAGSIWRLETGAFLGGHWELAMPTPIEPELGVWWVDGVAGVDEDKGHIGNTPATAFLTIEEGLAAAESDDLLTGSTIYVLPATGEDAYAPTSTLNITEAGLTLKSTNGPDETTIIPSIVVDGINIGSSAIGATVAGFDVEGGGGDTRAIRTSAKDSIIQSNTVNTGGITLEGGATGVKVLGNEVDHCTMYVGGGVSDCTLSGNSFGGGLNLEAGIHEIAVTNNNIIGSQYAGISFDSSGSFTDILIQGNTISGTTNGVAAGVQVKSGQTFTNLTITDNDITDNGVGILIESGVTWSTGNAINNNNISGNTDYGIENAIGGETPPVVNAENNWWGHTSGPADTDGESPCYYDPDTGWSCPTTDPVNAGGLGDEVSDDVDYCPWLLEPVDVAETVIPDYDTVSTEAVGDYAGWRDSTAVTSVAFSPNFDSDDTILAITTDDDDSGTYLQTGRLGNVEQWNYIAGSAFPDAVEIVNAPPLAAADCEVLVTDGTATGIALSADYDGRKSGLRYVWVYVDYDDPDDDPDLGKIGRVFQIDNDVVDYAGLPCTEGKFTPLLASISAYGTEDEGKLMVGLAGKDEQGDTCDFNDPCEGVQVYYTTMPINTCCPDWDSSDKPPTGQGCALVSYVADGDKAYASTMGEGRADEGAFSISEIEEVGLYWNQYSLIDTDIDYLSDFASGDCWNSGQYFITSINLLGEGCEPEGSQVCECDSLWYSEDWGEHYMRVWCGEFTPNDVNVAFEGDVTNQIGFIRVSPDESSWVETLYMVDRGTEIVWWNDSSGLTDWSEQSTCTVDAISDLAVADPSTIYAVSATAGEVAKSTDNGESWDDPVDADMVSGEAGHTIAVNGDDVLFGGNAGSVSYSEDGGESFDILAWEQAVGYGNVHVAFDAYYGLNNIVYAADGGGGGISRWPIGSDTDGGNWEELDATPTLNQMGGSGDDELDVNYYGIVSKSSGMCDADDGGVLYAAYAYNDGTDYYTGVARCLTPAADLCCGEADWDYLHTGLITGAEDQWFPQQFTTEPSSLKVAGTPGFIWIDAIDNSSVFADIIINDPVDGYGCYYAYDYWWGLGAVYYYEDCFAEGGVSLSAPMSGSLIPSDPCNCWNEKFVLDWEQPCDGCLYDVQIALDEDFNDIYLEWEDYDPPSARSPSLVIDDGDLDCSTTYYWRVRACEADTGEVVRSWWSVAWDFAVGAGPAGAIRLTAPEDGATDVAVRAVLFTWTSVAGAKTYDFKLMDSDGTEVDSQTGLTGTSYTYAGPLGFDAPYTWQVTAMKGTGMSKSDTVSVSQLSTFRTAPAEVFTCPQCGLTFPSEAALKAHIAEAHAPVEPTTPTWVWVIIGLGAALVIVVIVLIFRTRRV